MSQSPKNIHPAVAKSLEVWHAMIARNDLSDLHSIVDPDAVFRSPMAHTSYGSAQAVILALTTVSQVFKNFNYHRQFASDDGMNFVLEFSAEVGDKELKGVDLIRFNDEGRIVEFEVMVRPMSGLQALGAEMAQRISSTLSSYKVKA